MASLVVFIQACYTAARQLQFAFTCIGAICVHTVLQCVWQKATSDPDTVSGSKAMSALLCLLQNMSLVSLQRRGVPRSVAPVSAYRCVQHDACHLGWSHPGLLCRFDSL